MIAAFALGIAAVAGRVLDHGLSIAKVIVFVADRRVPAGPAAGHLSASGRGAWRERDPRAASHGARAGRVVLVGRWPCSAAFASAPCCCSSSPRRCCRTSGSTCSASTCASRWSRSASGWPGAAAACSTLGQGVFFGLGAYADGDAPQARRRRPRRRCPTSWPLTASDALPGWWEPFRSPWSRCWRSSLLPALVAAAARPRDLPPPGPRRLLRDPVARRWPRRSRSCSSASTDGAPAAPTASTTSGLLRLRPRRPGEPADAVLHRRRCAAGDGRAGPPADGAAATASCWWPAATPRSGCASSATTRRTSRRRLRVGGVHGRHRRGAVRADRRHHLAGDVGIVPSIGFLIGVAIGGRTTLLGPVLGAIAVAWARTHPLGDEFPRRLDLPPGLPVHAGRSRSCPAGWRRWASVWRAAARPVRTGRRRRRRARRRSTRPRRATPARSGVMSDRLPGAQRRCTVVLRRVRRRRRGRPVGAPRRPAVPDRTERRGQDHADRRRLRAGAGHRVGPVRRASSWWARRCTGSPGSASGARSRPRRSSRS